MVHSDELSAEVSRTETNAHSLAGHIWLSPQLQASYLGTNQTKCA